MNETKKRVYGVLSVILALVVIGAGCLAFGAWMMYALDQAESLCSERHRLPFNPALFAEARTEADYDRIARDFLEQQIGRRNLRPYNIMWYHRDCSGVGSVPDGVSIRHLFRYYGIAVNSNVIFSPHGDEVVWTCSVSKLDYDAIDLSSRRVNIPQALEIVEANGGKDFRQAEESSCEITVFGVPIERYGVEAGTDDWDIRYTRENSTLCAFVNSQTGDHNIYEMDASTCVR